MENLESIFNGEKPKVLEDKPKQQPISLKGAKERASRDNQSVVPYSSSTAYSNFDNGVKYGSENPYAESRIEDAEAQTFGEYTGKFVGNTLSNIVTGTIGGIGYLGTLAQGDKKKDYSNAITEWADSMRNPFGDVKTKTDNILDISDPAFWVNNGQSLIESAVQFGIIAETGGMASGAMIGKLGKILKMGNTAKKVVGAGMQALTAMELSYLEGAMSGAQVYRDIYKAQYDRNIKEGKTIEEADNIAKSFASKGASSTVQLNTTIGTALNLTGIGAVFNKEMSPSLKYFMSGAGKRLEGEATKDYVRRLALQSPQFINEIGKTKYGELFAEMGQEGVEEVVTQLAENVGRQQGIDGKDYGFGEQFLEATKSIKSVMNDEGVLNFALGALGGLGQTVLLQNIIPSQKINKLDSNGKLIPKMKDGEVMLDKKGNPLYETQFVSPRKRDTYDNLLVFNDLTDSLNHDLSFISNQIDKISQEKNPLKREEYKRQLFAVNTLDSIFKGMGSNLIESYREINATDNNNDIANDILEQANKVKEEGDKILNGRSIEELSPEEKEAVDQLQQKYVQLQKQALEGKDKTQAMLLGLANNKEDNDFKKRGEIAIAQIEDIAKAYEKYKNKYNLPEEENVHYAEYLTKLYADVKGRETIQNDLEADWNRNKADFQLFAQMEDYATIETMLQSSELISYEQDMEDLHNKRSKLVDGEMTDEELEEAISELDVKVDNKHEALLAIEAKLKKLSDEYQTKKVDFLERVKQSKAFIESKQTSPEKFVSDWAKKYPEYQRLSDFKQYLDTYKRNTENVRTKLLEATSKEGRVKYLKAQNAMIEAMKRQVEMEHNIYTYNQAYEELENDEYIAEIEKVAKQKSNLVAREIVNIENEIKVLEGEANIGKDKSRFSSIIEYFNFNRFIEEQIKMRKGRLKELSDFIQEIEKDADEAKAKILSSTSKDDKDKTLANQKVNAKPVTTDDETDDSDDEDDDDGASSFSEGREAFLSALDEDEDEDFIQPKLETPISDSELDNVYHTTVKTMYDNQKRITKVPNSPYIIDGKTVNHRVSQIGKGKQDSSGSQSSPALNVGSAIDKVARQFVTDIQGIHQLLLIQRAIHHKDYNALRKMLDNYNSFFNITLDEMSNSVNYKKSKLTLGEVLSEANDSLSDSELLDKANTLIKYKENRRINATNNLTINVSEIRTKQGTLKINSPTPLVQLGKYLRLVVEQYNRKGYYIVADSIVLFDMDTKIGSIAGETDMIALKNDNGVVKGKILDFKTGKEKNIKDNYSKPSSYNNGLSDRDSHTRQTSIYSVLLEKQYGVTLQGYSRILPLAVQYDSVKNDSNTVTLNYLLPADVDMKQVGKKKVMKFSDTRAFNYTLPIDRNFVDRELYDTKTDVEDEGTSDDESGKLTPEQKEAFSILYYSFFDSLLPQYQKISETISKKYPDVTKLDDNTLNSLHKGLSSIVTIVKSLVEKLGAIPITPETSELHSLMPDWLDVMNETLFIIQRELANRSEGSERYQELIDSIDNVANVFTSLINSKAFAKNNKDVKPLIQFIGKLKKNGVTGKITIKEEDIVNAIKYINSLGLQGKSLELENQLHNAIIALYDVLHSIDNVDKKIQSNIKRLLTEIKNIRSNIPVSEDEEGDDGDSGSDNGDIGFDTIDDEPITVNMFRVQFGNLNDKNELSQDAKTTYEIQVGEDVSLRIEPSDDAETRIAIYNSSNKFIGYIPTLNFMRTKYANKSNGVFEKLYYDDSSSENKAKELVFVEKEIIKFGLDRNSIITRDENEGVTIVDYVAFNTQRIEKLRNHIDSIVASGGKVEDVVIKGKVTSKGNGRPIKSNRETTLFASNILNDKRVSLALVSNGKLYSSNNDISKYSTNALSRIANINNTIYVYLSYPNANGKLDLFPVRTLGIGQDNVNLLYKLLMSDERDNYYKDIQDLLTVYGNDEVAKKGGYKNTVRLFSYLNLNNNTTRDYVIKEFDEDGNMIKSTSLFNKNSSDKSKTIGINPEFKVAIKKMKDTPIPIDKKLMSDGNKPFPYFVLDDKGNVKKAIANNYHDYLKKHLSSNLAKVNENNDKNGKPIYVTDFVVNMEFEISADKDQTQSGDSEVPNSKTENVKPVAQTKKGGKAKSTKKKSKQEKPKNEPKKSTEQVEDDFEIVEGDEFPDEVNEALSEMQKDDSDIVTDEENEDFEISEDGDSFFPDFEIPSDDEYEEQYAEDGDYFNFMGDEDDGGDDISKEYEEEEEDSKPTTTSPSGGLVITSLGKKNSKPKPKQSLIVTPLNIKPLTEDDEDIELSPIPRDNIKEHSKRITELKLSTEKHLAFTGMFIERNVLKNTSLSESDKLSLMREALLVNSMDDANKLFDKICKS